jgi:Spy/CpxP family protein refolding chaperone
VLETIIISRARLYDFSAMSGIVWLKESIRLDLPASPEDDCTPTKRRTTMKKRIHLITTALAVATLAFIVAPSYAQTALSKAEGIAKELNLTPDQKAKILPLLQAEVPKVNAIKNDNSLNRMQKVQQIKAIHQQTDPQMKSILTPAQYEKLKTIRQQAIRDAIQSRGVYR